MITQEEAYNVADRYLLEIGQFLAPKEPKFDQGKQMWIVPVFHHSKVARFEIGEMTIDTKGNVITLKMLEDSPEIRELEKYNYESLGLAEK